MANPVDATTTEDNASGESLQDKIANFKTQFEAEENGASSQQVSNEDEEQEVVAEADEASDASDSAAGNTEDEGESDGSEDGESEESDSDFRFSQFKGDGKQESYVKNLENGYDESSKEALRIKQERDAAISNAGAFERQVNAIKAAAEKDPEFGRKLLGLLEGSADSAKDLSGTSAVDKPADETNPFLKDAQTKWEQQSEKEAKEFVEANPEVVSDPDLNKQVKRWMKLFSEDIYKEEGRLATSGELMKLAYKHLGLEDKRKSKESLVNGMKKTAAPTRPQKKAVAKPQAKQFSDKTLSMAQKMGITKERLEKGVKR